jgi:putative PIN family toxin of toxin-antitoxin system
LTRLLLDTSVLLSGAVAESSSPPGRLLASARTGAFELVACPLIFEELRRGLAKPYFRARVSAEEADSLLVALELIATVFPNPESPKTVLRDPNDDFLVALAVVASAHAIVTGDRDLLDHPELRPPAIDARAGCELLGLQEGRTD